MAKIVVLTPSPSDPSYSSQWPVVMDRLKGALEPAGFDVSTSPWTDHVTSVEGLRDYDLILPLLTWGYYTDYADWCRACDLWEAEGLPVANPARTLRWNSDKAYLKGLRDAGIPMAATLFVDQANEQNVAEAFDALGTDVLIVKPTISAGAWRTLRIQRGDDLAAAMRDAPQGAAMIQAYLPSIETAGETSLLFFGGALSHVVNKRPGAEGEFRIQVQYGGRYQALPQPPQGALALAEQVLAQFDDDLLYARIDMTQTDDGQWVLMEAELVEPDFYLASDPKAGARFAAAVKARI
ncbi:MULTISPECIES: ATP-grasp domain-containing protein [unclassified Brevundimonas]|uniref:ATP-grasp domain-containing protein n=1 Tax=unclassified Brevundimonas TaxID=2622653 RepID=UPI0025BEDB51|nr:MULTISPECIES: transporter [unclassified Brevundimonas]